MAISAQDKILYVANKLGLSTLKNMQGSTGVVYDTDVNNTGVLFTNAGQHVFAGGTNINDNKFEVNSALLIETISFFANVPEAGVVRNLINQEGTAGLLDLNDVIVFDLIIGNKVVMKDTPIFGYGGPYCFASTQWDPGIQDGIVNIQPYVQPRHQIYMEGVGILIPPQVEYSINFSVFNMLTGAKKDVSSTPMYSSGYRIGAYLYGTQVLLNFNTSI